MQSPRFSKPRCSRVAVSLLSLAAFGGVIVPMDPLRAGAATWNNAAGGPWGTPANWTPSAVPDGIGASATFGSAITAPGTIDVDGSFTVSNLVFDNANSYTLSGNTVTIATNAPSSLGSITVNSGAHTIASALNLAAHTSITTAAGSGLLVTGDMTATAKNITKFGLGTAQFNNVRAMSLDVVNGSLKITPGATPNSPAGTSVVKLLLLGNTPNLDLTNNSLIDDYSGSVPGNLVGTFRGHLRAGRMSSSSATATTRIGYGDNMVLHKTIFAGQPVPTTSVLFKYTYAGDADLDGDADGVDIGTWATNFTGEQGVSGTKVWTQGDWDYDGDVDGVDAGLWAQAFTGELGGAGLGSLVIDDPSIAPGAASILRGMGITVVPEPGTIGAVAAMLAAGTVLQRRRTRGASHRR
ncbi:MAG TPA: PEP-CTERM sorting domain-containing protein [Tepidisphaeraceae bacterium]|jgi:hypothetical protein